jgi:hypothetical protein
LEQTICKTLSLAGWIKLNRQLLTGRHLPKVCDVRANDRNPVRTSQVRYSTATGGRGVGHHSDAGTLEQLRQTSLGNIPEEFDPWIASMQTLHRVGVAASLGMIAACDDQLRLWLPLGQQMKGFDHQFQSLVRSPLAEGKNTMLGITATRKVGEFRTPREDAVGPQMHIVAPVLIVQNFPVSGHENRDGIGQ